jgi:hypothetical protein
MDEFNNYFKRGGVLKFDGGGYLSRNADQYNRRVLNGIIKKYNTGGPISWTLSDEWHAPLLPSYVNSKPYASDSVSGFNNAKEVYEYILSLPGSNPAIAAG